MRREVKYHELSCDRNLGWPHRNGSDRNGSEQIGSDRKLSLGGVPWAAPSRVPRGFPPYHCCGPAFDKFTTRTSADVSVPRLAGFSLITLIADRQ